MRNPNRNRPAGDLVAITTDAMSGRPLARCTRCAETVTADRESWVMAWADSHVCDPELAALLNGSDGFGGWAA